jgi:hypothetical protein
MNRAFSTLLAVTLFLSAAAGGAASLPTSSWHPASSGKATWGLPEVRYAALSDLKPGLSRKEVFSRLGRSLPFCVGASHFACCITWRDRKSYHVALAFDSHGALTGVSYKEARLQYHS